MKKIPSPRAKVVPLSVSSKQDLEKKRIPLKEVLVMDIMIRKPVTIDITSPFSMVVELFKEHKIRHLPVINQQKVLQGIITQRDLYRITTPRKGLEGELIYDKATLDRFILKHVMKKDVVSLSPTDTLLHVIEIMLKKKYGCVPVIDKNGFLQGIITQIDLLRVFAKYL